MLPGDGFYVLSLELVYSRDRTGKSAFLSGVAGEIEVKAPRRAFIGGELGPEFQAGAAAFDVGAAEGEAVVGAAGLTVKFVFVGEAGVVVKACAVLGIAGTDTHQAALDVVEVIVTAGVEGGVFFERVEVLAVDIQLGVVMVLEDLADAEVGAVVGRVFGIAVFHERAVFNGTLWQAVFRALPLLAKREPFMRFSMDRKLVGVVV